MGLNAYTSRIDGSGRTPLDTIAPVGALAYGNGSNGDTTCSLSMALPVTANPEALTAGRRLWVTDGPCTVWGGILADPQRGHPWTITGQGYGTLAARFLALSADGSASATDPNVAVDAAISRGLPWSRPVTLPTPNVAPTGTDIGSLLDAVDSASSVFWQVDQFGHLAMVARPLSPTYILIAGNTPGGRSTDNFATDLWAKYTPPMSVLASPGPGSTIVAGPPQLTPATNPASTAPRPFGRWEAIYDTTAGIVTATNAAADATAALARVRPDPTYTGQIAVTPGALLTLGGEPVRLSTVRAMTAVRMVGVQPDPGLAQLTFTTSVQIVIGAWDYNAVADTAVMTPLGATTRDLTALLTLAATAPTSALVA